MNLIFGLLAYCLRYLVGWGSLGRNARYPIDEFARETKRVWDEADRDSKTNGRIAPEIDFVSTTVPVEGAVDYSELKWDAYSSAIEMPKQFLFYDGRNIAKVIAKSEFSDTRQIAALRRVIRRRVAECQLLDD